MNNTISDIDIDLTAVCEAEDDAAQAEAQPAQNESDDTYAQKMGSTGVLMGKRG